MKKGNTVVLTLIGVAIMIAAGYFAFTSITNRPNEEATESQEEAMMEGDEAAMQDSSVMTMLMENENSLKTDLTDVSGGEGKGVAYVLRDDKLHHYVEASLPDTAGSMVYEGWLVKKAPKLEFFSTGVMEKNADGKYILSYESDELYEGYDNVVITLETTVDEVPEEHILEGTFN